MVINSSYESNNYLQKIQHFEAIEFFGGEESKTNNLNMIHIPYTVEDISYYLFDKINPYLIDLLA